jgi:hypothetical protein
MVAGDESGAAADRNRCGTVLVSTLSRRSEVAPTRHARAGSVRVPRSSYSRRRPWSREISCALAQIDLDRFLDARAPAPLDALQIAPGRARRPLCAVFENDAPAWKSEPGDRSTESLLEWQKLRCYKGE